MPRIVLATMGSFGDLNPYIALGLGLRARGHDPVVATIEFYRKPVEAAGLEFHPVRPDMTPDPAVLERVMDPVKGSEVVVRELLMPYVRESYADLVAAASGADLLVSHPVTFAGPIAGERLGMPWISTVLAPLSFFSAYELPVFPPMPRLSKVGALGPGVSRLLIRVARHMTRGWSEPVRQLRRELGLGPGKDPIFEGQFSPHMTLGMFSRVLATPQPDWPPGARITGHAFYDERPGSPGLPPALERFLDAGPAPIVFTLGTSAVHAPGTFYRDSARAAERLGARAVLLVGDDVSAVGRERLPAGVAAFDYAPFSKLFPRCAAIVHHGGIGTTGQALRSGRPMLVMPFAHDQPDNAHRVTKLGVARTLYLARSSPDRLAREIRPLVEDSRYADRAREIGAIVGSEEGVGAACDAVEAVLRPDELPMLK
jgi:UDP:flavonoid glycosyltransferase YjiC (YdhE family)